MDWNRWYPRRFLPVPSSEIRGTSLFVPRLGVPIDAIRKDSRPDVGGRHDDRERPEDPTLASRIFDHAAPDFATIGTIYDDCSDGIRSVVDANG